MSPVVAVKTPACSNGSDIHTYKHIDYIVLVCCARYCSVNGNKSHTPPDHDNGSAGQTTQATMYHQNGSPGEADGLMIDHSTTQKQGREQKHKPLTVVEL